jgi:hypothetical protein
MGTTPRSRVLPRHCCSGSQDLLRVAAAQVGRAAIGFTGDAISRLETYQVNLD